MSIAGETAGLTVHLVISSEDGQELPNESDIERFLKNRLLGVRDVMGNEVIAVTVTGKWDPEDI